MRTEVDILSAAERQSQVAHWHKCILPAGECGDYETLRTVLEKVTEQKYFIYHDLMNSIALALFHAIVNDAQEFVVYFWDQLRVETLEPLKGMLLAVDTTSGGNFLRPNFLGGKQSPSSLVDVWNRARSSFESRLEWVEPNARHQALIALFKELNECMSVWRNGNARFDDYLNARETFARGHLETLLRNLSRAGDMVWEGKDRREEIGTYLRLVEERALTSIFEEYQGRVLTQRGATDGSTVLD